MNNGPSSLVGSILKSGLIVAALDFCAAITHSFIFGKGNPAAIWRYVASGVFGKEAFEGGSAMVAWGILFHIMVATGWTALFFVLYPRLGFLSANKFVSGIGYGMFIWLMMNFVVVPLSQVPPGQLRFTVGTAAMILIHMFVIGVPIAYLAGRNLK